AHIDKVGARQRAVGPGKAGAEFQPAAVVLELAFDALHGRVGKVDQRRPTGILEDDVELEVAVVIIEGTQLRGEVTKRALPADFVVPYSFGCEGSRGAREATRLVALRDE